MRYTEPARAALDAYLARVRRALEGRSDVDAGDVVAGLAEHVEAELAFRAADPATAEDVAEVLERVGPVETVGEVGGKGEAAGDGGGVAPEVARGPTLAVLTVALAGIVLLPTRLMPVGVVLLLTTVVAARLVLPGAGPVHSVEGRLIRALWGIGAAVTVVGLLLGPAVLVWSQAQIGGVLEAPLARHVGAEGAERPIRYWLAMAGAAGLVTGTWWMVLGLVVRRFGDAIRRGLGAASPVVPVRSAPTLIRVGLALFVVSLFGVWLS